MEIRHLTSFLAVAEELHFTRAARKVHLTQSALSDQIQKLEQDVGASLLTRTSRRVSLTAAGVELRGRAQAILMDVEAARTAAHQASRGRIGTLSVGYSMLASQSALPRAIERMYAGSPGIHLRLHEERTGPQLEALAAGGLDVAVVYGLPTANGLSVRKLHGIGIVAVVGRRDPIARAGSARFGELAKRDCVMFERAHSPVMYDAIVSGANRAGFTLKITETVNDPCASLVMVTTRNLVGFTSCTEAGVIRSTPGADATVAVHLVDPTPAVDLCAAWRSDDPNPAVHDFVEHLVASSVEVAMAARPGALRSPMPAAVRETASAGT